MFVRIYVVLCILFTFPLYPQQPGEKLADSLRDKSYKSLFINIKSEKIPKQKQLYLRAYLVKAQKEGNWERMVNGYKNYMYHSDPSLKLTYADSMIYIARKSGDSVLIGASHLTKGITYYGQKDIGEAFDHYIIAYDYLNGTRDEYQKHKTMFMIAQVKYYLGYYNQAIKIYNYCLSYFKTANSRGYLNTLHSLSLCYNRMGNYGLSSEINTLGLAEAKRLNNHSMDMFFNHSEGINHYKNKNYNLAIECLTQALPSVISIGDFSNVSVGYFYLGRSYWALGKVDKALFYFKKVDEIFNREDYIRTDLRENYQLLIRHYDKDKNLDTKLYYIKQLIKVDSVLNSTYRDLSGKIYEDFDIRVQQRQEEQIKGLMERIREILEQNRYSDMLWAFFSGILLLFGMFVINRQYTNKKKYKAVLEEINSGKKVQQTQKPITGELNIKEEVIDTILKQLEKFEDEKEFLHEDLNLVKLAAVFDVNNKYLSKVIWHYKHRKFVDYIKDLKINYMLYLLKNKKVYRAYSNKALAKDAGFSTTQSFVRAFKSRVGFAPSVFIKDLDKKDKTS